jgi:hypothetical protein
LIAVVALRAIVSGKDRLMRLLLTLLTVAAAVAVAPIAASGAAFHSSESFTDPDFCGTGARVDVLVENTLAHLSERDGVGKAEHQGTVTFTYGDASVIVSFAGQFTDTIVATEAGGVEIHLLVGKGIPEKIQLANGPVLLIDAGMIVVLNTVQDGNLLNSQIVGMNGPHPDAASGFSLFCEIIPQALGIT